MTVTGSRNDPYTAFRFEVRVDQQAVGGFSECQGLGYETDVETYVEGGVNDVVHKFPGHAKQSNLTLKRGIVSRQLWQWYRDAARGAPQARNLSIAVYAADGTTKTMEFRCDRAFPVKWTGPDLNAKQSEVAVETLELCHRGLDWRPG